MKVLKVFCQALCDSGLICFLQHCRKFSRESNSKRIMKINIGLYLPHLRQKNQVSCFLETV